MVFPDQSDGAYDPRLGSWPKNGHPIQNGNREVLSPIRFLQSYQAQYQLLCRNPHTHKPLVMFRRYHDLKCGVVAHPCQTQRGYPRLKHLSE
jgi:hypothetical protein